MARTNKLLVSFEYEGIDRSFDLYRITTSDKYIGKGARCLDGLILESNALSVAFDYGKCAYALYKKGNVSKLALSNALSDPKLSISQVYSQELKSYILLRLFLYSLGNYQSEANLFNNLTGKLFLVNPSWQKANKKNLVALQIDVDNELALSANATTFSLASCFKNLDRSKLSALPQYVLEMNGKLRRKLSSDQGGPFYIRKGVPGRKTDIPFLDLNSDKIHDTRAYFIYKAIEELNKRHRDVLHADFAEMEIEESIATKRDEGFASAALEALRSKDVYIKNLISDPLYEESYLQLKESLESYIGKPLIENKAADKKEGCSILFLHDKDFYEDAGDPYKSIRRDEVVQCITLEDSSDKIINDSKAVINTIVKEIVIKDDIVNQKRITLDDWSSFGFRGDWHFGMEKDQRKYFMTVHKDGSFEMTTRGVLSFGKNDVLGDLSSRIDDSDAKSKSIVMDDRGNINLISCTGLYCLPDPEIFSLPSLSRSKAFRDRYLQGIVDINLYEQNGECFYSAGPIGSGMRAGIPKSSLIYKVDILRGDNIIADILATLSVIFVKYNSFTVLPYPFKYLREYIQMEESGQKLS